MAHSRIFATKFAIKIRSEFFVSKFLLWEVWFESRFESFETLLRGLGSESFALKVQLRMFHSGSFVQNFRFLRFKPKVLLQNTLCCESFVLDVSPRRFPSKAFASKDPLSELCFKSLTTKILPQNNCSDIVVFSVLFQNFRPERFLVKILLRKLGMRILLYKFRSKIFATQFLLWKFCSKSIVSPAKVLLQKIHSGSFGFFHCSKSFPRKVSLRKFRFETFARRVSHGKIRCENFALKVSFQ